MNNASPKGAALQVTSPLRAWSLLITNKMLNIIVIHTNEQIDRTVPRVENTENHHESCQKHINIVELKAFIGLLYYAGLFKVNRTKCSDLWSVLLI